MEFPQFYHHKGRCIKRESESKAIEIRIPETGSKQPLVYTDMAEFGIEKAEQIDAIVAGMKACDQQKYESFLATFYQASQSNRQVFNNYRQQQFDARASSQPVPNLTT